MPTCANCRQEVDFYEQGGLFYCNECDTQSQVMHVIEKDDVFNDIRDFTHLPMHYTRKKNQTVTEEDRDDGQEQERSWWSCELYQAILKAQVKALVAMGFSSKLDEIVMQLWFHYLSKSGTAFCRTLQPSEAAEQDKRGNGEECTPKTSQVTGKGKRKRKVLCKDDWLHRSEKGTVVPKRAQRSRTDRIRLSLWDSVCFIYIGLQSLKEPVLLSDMIRWVREGHLPLRSTANVVPEHISKNMSAKDIARFCSPFVFMPDVNYVFSLLRELSAKLEVAQLSSSKMDMSFTIARVVHGLNLPVELCQYVHGLLEQVLPSQLEKSLLCDPISPECQAVAYIIVALKLLLGLNDCTEHSFSEQTRRLQELFPAGVCLFNWDVWVEAQKLRVKQQLYHEGSIQNSSDLNKVNSMNGFVQHFKRFYQVEQIYKHLHALQSKKHGYQERLKEYQRPFCALHKEPDSSLPSHLAPSSFVRPRTTWQPDCRDNSNSSVENIDDLPKPTASFDWLPTDYLLDEDFSKHTLRHLTNLQELCEQCIIPPDDVTRVLDLAVRGNSPSPSTLADADSKSSDSLTKRLKVSKSKKRSASRKTDKGKKQQSNVSGDVSYESLPGSFDSDINKEDCKHKRKILLGSLSVPYVTYPTCSGKRIKPEHQKDCFHTSVAWLFDHCSVMWEMRPKLISLCVLTIEQILFKE